LQLIHQNFLDNENSLLEIARHGADTILQKLSHKSSIKILTIWYTGKLAMPGVGTALGITREINNRKKLYKLYIPESRPYNQGSRLTAFEAKQDKLPGNSITDSMAGMLMSKKMVDCVIFGADKVTKNGATANKIGTYTFSVLAKQNNIPLYVACPVSTIDFQMNCGWEIHIEKKPADEFRKIQNINLSPKDIDVWNPSFDVTPPSHIKHIITEKGCYDFDRNCDIWEKLKINKFGDNLKYKLIKINKNDEVEVNDVADGNLNNVYCVKVKSKSSEEIKEIHCIKQALPSIIWVGTSWPMSVKRCMDEDEHLKYENLVSPDCTPKFLAFDHEMSTLDMEFLKNHIILRYGIDGWKEIL
jgi:5-methylthioribose kinase